MQYVHELRAQYKRLYVHVTIVYMLALTRNYQLSFPCVTERYMQYWHPLELNSTYYWNDTMAKGIIITPTVDSVYRDWPGSSALNLYI